MQYFHCFVKKGIYGEPGGLGGLSADCWLWLGLQSRDGAQPVHLGALLSREVAWDHFPLPPTLSNE